jgi:pilus assembly protein CpaF
VHLSRLRDGTRRITHISEIEGMEQERITLNTVFEFDLAAGVDANGHYLGSLQPTGIRPKFIERLAEHGVTMDPAIFRPTAPTKPSRRKPV